MKTDITEPIKMVSLKDSTHTLIHAHTRGSIRARARVCVCVLEQDPYLVKEPPRVTNEHRKRYGKAYAYAADAYRQRATDKPTRSFIDVYGRALRATLQVDNAMRTE